MVDQFQQAITQYLENSAPLLSIGERQVLNDWTQLSTEAKRLYIFLFHRKPKQFRREHIQYVDHNKSHYFTHLEEEDNALIELEHVGFIFQCQHLMRTELFLDCLRKPEIVKLCKVFSVDANGSKLDCLDRIVDFDIPRTTTIYHLEHRLLFHHACRQYTYAHPGDLQQLLLASLDEVPISFVPYTTTQTFALHHTRTELKDYLNWKSSDPNRVTPLIQHLTRARYRFSGQRFWIAYLLNTPPDSLTETWIRDLYSALSVSQTETVQITLRLALTLFQFDKGHDGLQLLVNSYRSSESLLEKLQFSQTGRYLARRLKSNFPPLPPLLTATERRLQWTTKKIDTRQTYNGMPVEYAVIQHLVENKRTAIRTENSPWNSLFSLLFLDILFDPIEGQLPSPILSGPIDFGTHDLYLNRKELFDTRLTEIEEYGPLPILNRNTARLDSAIENYHIRGCRWRDFSYDSLLDFAASVPIMTLLAILKHKLIHPIQSHRGMPDLCVLPADSVRIPDLFPSKIHSGFFFVEVKSERDTLSPYQHHWIHILKESGCVVEVWNIHSKGRKNA